MSDNTMQPNETDQPKRPEPDQEGQQTEQSPPESGGTTAQPAGPHHRPAPGRRPLFGS